VLARRAILRHDPDVADMVRAGLLVRLRRQGFHFLYELGALRVQLRTWLDRLSIV
jgi:hypothetical protein